MTAGAILSQQTGHGGADQGDGNSSRLAPPEPKRRVDEHSTCNGLQTRSLGLANKGHFRLTFRANKGRPGLTIPANEPTLGSWPLLVTSKVYMGCRPLPCARLQPRSHGEEGSEATKVRKVS